MESVAKRSARAILIDDQGDLVLIKRTQPRRAPYWTAPGGSVEPDDPSVEAALVRELREELGADVASAQQVFLVSNPAGDGVSVQHFFVCRLRHLDLSRRSGPERSTARGPPQREVSGRPPRTRPRPAARRARRAERTPPR